MVVFLFIALSIPLLTMLWLVWAVRHARKSGAPRLARMLPVVVSLIFLAGYAWIFFQRGGELPGLHPWLYAFVLIWALGALPFLALPLAAAGVVSRAWSRFRPRGHAGNQEQTGHRTPREVSRRTFLKGALATLPPVAAVAATAFSIPQTRHFRVREIVVPVDGLPSGLDGFSIAHISDVHAAKFTRGRTLLEIAEATTDLGVDLVVNTGDLIDHRISDLPEALDMFEKIDSRLGIYSVEGNHDLFDDQQAFVNMFAERGLPLLRDGAARINHRGTDIDLLGIRWHGRNTTLADHVSAVSTLRTSGAFPILLAHHPHAFDHSAEAGIPLTLAGHTHGGQIMVTPRLGAANAMFRYWSGLYQQDDCSLIVSNGAGNWFPLRTAAPAEIIRIELRRKEA